MTKAALCHLLVPGLFEAPERLPENLPTPNLDRILGHARPGTENPRGFEQILCSHFSLTANAGEDLPTGALSLLGDGGNPGDAVWANIAPAHLYPDRDRLLLFPLAATDFPDDFVAHVQESFNAHFDDRGLELNCLPGGRWYLRFSRDIRVRTHPLADVGGRSVDPFLPEGEDAGVLRSILNEAQMLLHQLSGDINGPERFNTFWIWGIGPLPGGVSSAFDTVVSGDYPLLSGLADMAGMEIKNELDGDAGSFLMVDCRLREAVQFGDMGTWCEALESIDASVGRLLDGANAPRCKIIVLQDDLGHVFRYRRGMNWLFRKRGAFRRLVAAKNEQSGSDAVPF